MFPLLNFLLWCVCGYVLAQEDFPQRCESRSLATQENFNITRFLGVWYDTNHVNASFMKCPIIKLERVSDVEFSIEHLEYETDNKSVVLNSGADSFVGRHNNSMLLTYQNSTNATLTVVATDYDGYAVLWLCTNFNGSENQSRQQLWIWVRNYSLPASALTAINSTLVNNNLTDFHNASNLDGQDQCRFLEITDYGNVVEPGIINNATAAPSLNVTTPVNNNAVHHNHTSHNGAHNIRCPNCEFTALMVITAILLSAIFKQT